MFKRLIPVGVFVAAALVACGAPDDFAVIARHALAGIHAKSFREGDIKGCVAIYAADAKFFVDNKLVASGPAELLKLYTGLREEDGVRKIEIDEFVDIGRTGGFGWAIFNYTKQYELKGRDPEFLKRHQLESFATLNIKQHGTALFVKIDGQWKIRLMSVFDPEVWEPQK